MTASVAVLQKSLPHYRVPFFSLLRERLRAEGVDLRLIYGDSSPEHAARHDTVELRWAEFRRNRFLRIGSRTAVWQPALDVAHEADLVIVEQAAKLLLNYRLLVSQVAGSTRVAFWGHGANLQRHTANPSAETVKRAVSRTPHWWFAYTDDVRRRVEGWGYPADRITVVQNASDATALRKWRADLASDADARVRVGLGLGSGPVVATLGSLYDEGRLAFLLSACDRVCKRIPGFRLLVIGDGPAREKLIRLAAGRPYVRLLGALFDAEKVRALVPASLLLVPDLVGLSIVDAFALELPLVTMATGDHGPEIEYLVANTNGIIVHPAGDPDRYAEAVIDLLQSPLRLERLRQGCRRSAERYTIEAMVERFADGVHAALGAPVRWRPSVAANTRLETEGR